MWRPQSHAPRSAELQLRPRRVEDISLGQLGAEVTAPRPLCTEVRGKRNSPKFRQAIASTDNLDPLFSPAASTISPERTASLLSRLEISGPSTEGLGQASDAGQGTTHKERPP